jgi:hypothetical protein
MTEDAKNAVLTKLLESLPTLLVMLGVGLLVLGLAGGITYNAWLPIPDTVGRTGAVVAGVVVCGIGLLLFRSSKTASVIASNYGIRITHPKDGDEIEIADVTGTIRKSLPEGYSLRIFRIYPGSERITPIGTASVDIESGTWIAAHCHAGGKTGDKRSIAAFLVGASGVALIEYHNEAGQLHRKTLDQLRAAGLDGDYLPAIGTRTTDMFECHRVLVKRK